MRLSRFEKKILFSIGAVAIVPLVATLMLGRIAVREAYEVGVNPRVEEQLDSALSAHRRYLMMLRSDAGRTADAVADHWALRDAIMSGDEALVSRHFDDALRRHPNVAALTLRTGEGDLFARVEQRGRLDSESMRLLVQKRLVTVGSHAAMLEVTIATPTQPFGDYQRAGEVAAIYGRLRASADHLSGFYLAVYIGFLVLVIVAALAVGLVVSRRVTRRIVDLAGATRRVGAGDLSVELPSDVRDEIGELTRDFNQMVRGLRESRERIEYLQRIGAWQEFARRLAHEIKNPLTPIQLATQELLRSYEARDPRYRRKLVESCAIIEEELATLRRLVGEFSAFAKLPEAQLAPADLRELVQDVERSFPAILDDLTEAEDAPEVDLCCIPSDRPIPVKMDAMMLKRGLDNLVRNALQAVKRSGVDRRGKVVVEARIEGDSALFEVRDNGPGVPEADRSRVFDPYFTTKPDGTGLGLAIVKKVVLEHRGEIDCRQAAEGGAAFRIRLPLDPGAS